MHIHECIEIKERNLLRGENGVFHLDLLLKLQNPNRETSFVCQISSSAGEGGRGVGGGAEEEVGNSGGRGVGQKGINSSHQIAIIIGPAHT